ncbi:MAG: ATP-binding protein [Betaproteobacteria bacterium]
MLLAQWRVSRTRPMLILACGYIFTALMTIAHTLTFPGLFAPQGLLGAGRAEHDMAVHAVARSLPGVWLCSGAALVCLWRKRPRRVLDLWAMVVMCVWICEVALAAVLNQGRFDLGFYAGRIYGLAAASFLLGALLFEASALYARVAAASAEGIARAEAEAANRAKDQFLAQLGHGLRNPLAPIVTALHIMRMRDANALAHERLIIERQIAQLKRLVDDLLDIAGMARGVVEMRRTRCEVADIVARAVEMAGPALEARRHRLQVYVPAIGLTVDADGDRLAQALCNLLVNAAKYTPPEGSIEVSGERDGAQLILRVRDNGVGIAAELLPRLFQPFSQGARASERAQGGGLGLGLAIVRNIAALHGGNVEAKSAGAGKGAEFVMRLPAPDAGARWAARPTAQKGDAAADAPPGPDMHVLIVDDNADAAATLSLALRLRGVTVQTAFNAQEALLAAADHPPDAALIDLRLPGMDGYELAARLRKLPGLSALPMAAVTGYGLDSDIRRSGEAGFTAHFVKPMEVEAVLAFLRDAAQKVS